MPSRAPWMRQRKFEGLRRGFQPASALDAAVAITAGLLPALETSNGDLPAHDGETLLLSRACNAWIQPGWRRREPHRRPRVPAQPDPARSSTHAGPALPG